MRIIFARPNPRLDDRSVVFAAFDGDALVGFTLCFGFGRELTVRLNGLDYERLPDADVYANLTVHQP
ncbi:GNAT family N-acetyltransferase, partial [Streptomyces sp. NPDC048606]